MIWRQQILIFYRKSVYNIERDVTRWEKWVTEAIVSSSIQEKSVKRELIETDVLRLAAAVMRENMFHLLLFLFDAKFYELWTKEVRKLRVDIKYV